MAYASPPALPVPADTSVLRTLEVRLDPAGGRQGDGTGPTPLSHWFAALPVRRLDGVGTQTAALLAAQHVTTIGQLACTEPGTLQAALGPALAVALPAKARLLLEAVIRPSTVPRALGRFPIQAVALIPAEKLAGQSRAPMSVIEELQHACALIEICLVQRGLGNLHVGDVWPGTR